MCSIESCRTTSEEEIGIDGHRDETLFTSDLEMSFEIERLLGDLTVFLLGETHEADVVVDETLANQRIEVLKTTVQSNRCSTNGPGGENDLGFPNVKFLDGTACFVSDFECMDSLVAMSSSSAQADQHL